MKIEIHVGESQLIRKRKKEIFWVDEYALHLVFGASSTSVSTCHNSMNYTFEACTFC